jgi:hypothetical protein
MKGVNSTTTMPILLCVCLMPLLRLEENPPALLP